MSFKKSTFSQHTLYEFLRSNDAVPTSANPVHRTPFIPPSNRPLKFPSVDRDRAPVRETALQRLAKESAPIKTKLVAIQKPGRMEAVEKSDENLKPPPMFESAARERRGTKLNYVKGSSPQQLSKLKRRNSSTLSTAKLLSMDDLHKAVLSVDFSDIETSTDLEIAEEACLQYGTLDQYKARQSQVLLTETMEGFKQSLFTGYSFSQAADPGALYSTVNVTVTTAVKKGRDWCLLTLKKMDADGFLSQGDAVILLKPDSHLLEALLKYGFGSSRFSLQDEKGAVLFGIVDRTKTSLMSCNKQSKSVQLKCSLASRESPFGYSPSDAGVINSEWVAVIVHSLLTVEREWKGLCAIKPNSWFVPALLSSGTKYVSSPEAPDVSTRETGGLNESQRAAIHSASGGSSGSQRITIIQGPPGTGKTHTLVSLLKLFSRQKKRVIVCAPSNAAVDELMLRFVHHESPSGVVRVGGRNGSVSEKLHAFSLDQLVMSLQDKQESSRYEAYRLRKSKLHEDIRRLNDDLQSVGEAEQLKKSEIIRIKDRLKAQLENLKAKEQDSVKVERDAIYRKYLSSARFVFGTLSAFGADTVASNLIGEIDVCVIDEAAQAIEVSALIPLQFSPKRLVLVGDPQQLPAVVKSVAAKRARFDLSLMERLQLIGSVPTCMLCEQYRMDARIAEFPSNQFYEGKLITGPSLLRSENPLESLFVKNSPVLFFNCSSQSGGGDIKQGTSLMNATEARIVASLVHFLQDQHLDVSIGVISPYRQQVGLLRKLIDSGAEIDSVDAFQGREKDVIIFSCVRASGSSMGFLADVRRLNVAITRAKKAVWIVGNSDFLRANGGRVWEALVESCENNESVIPACRVEELTEQRLAKKVKILNDI